MSRLAAALVFILFLALLLHLSSRESYWLDEGYTLRRVEAAWPQLYYPFAIEPRENSTHPFDTTEVFDLNPPFYFALIRVLAGAHPGRVAVRLFSAIPMLLALAFIALLARRAYGRAGAWAVLLLGATAPAVIYYGHEARPYAFPLALACAMAWAMDRLATHPRRLFLAVATLTAAGCLMHFAFAWWVIAQGMLLFFLVLACGGSPPPDEARLDAPGEMQPPRPHARAALAGLLGCAAGALIALAVIAPQFAILTRCRYASSWKMDSRVLLSVFAFPFCRLGPNPIPPALGATLQFSLLFSMLVLLRQSRSFNLQSAICIPQSAIRNPQSDKSAPVFQSQISNFKSQIDGNDSSFIIHHSSLFPRPSSLSGALALASWLIPLSLPIIAKYWFNIAFIERYAFASLAGWLMCVGWVAAAAAARRGASRIFPLALLALIFLTNISWGLLNIPKPLRSQWLPAIAYLKQHSTPADVYTIDPYSENHCFAANAAAPPPARYVNLTRGMPAGAATLWILADESSRPRWDEGRVDPREWSVEHVLALHGIDLFRLTRTRKTN